MKNNLCTILVICSCFCAGCAASDTARPATSTADALKAAPNDQARKLEEDSIKSADIERQVRETHRLPNGQPIPGYDPSKDHNK